MDKTNIKWDNEKSGTFTDVRDNKTYKVVKIDNQIWMAEDLKYEGKDLKDRTFYSSAVYYTWRNAQKACPKGWHVPTEKDIIELMEFLGDDSYGSNEIAVPKLKNKTAWLFDEEDIKDDLLSEDEIETLRKEYTEKCKNYNSTGFNATPVSDTVGTWWISDLAEYIEGKKYGYYFAFVSKTDSLFWEAEEISSMSAMHFVRCILD